MPLDSPQKRMSVFDVPGLMTPPFPDGSIDVHDRVQMSDQYMGIRLAPPLPSRCTNWVNAKEKTSPWVASKKNRSTWVPEKEESQTWETEKNIYPCSD